MSLFIVLLSLNSSVLLSAKIVAIHYWRIAGYSTILALSCSAYIRTELLFPFIQTTISIYYSITTLHGLLFVFFVIVPIGTGLLNWWFPGQCSQIDFTWPRINVLSVIGTELGGVLIAFSWLGGGLDSGWTLYPPLSIYQEGYLLDTIICGLHVVGVFTLTSSGNTVCSVRKLFISFSYEEISLFSWCQFITALLLVGTVPSLALALLGVLLDRTTESCWFDPSGGGDPVLYQILFWFFGHPEVYVIILPSFGSVSASLESCSCLYGREGMICSVACIASLGYLVYGHHMFTVDLEMEVKLLFSSGSMTIAIPTGVKIFSWLMSVKSFHIEIRPCFFSVSCFMSTFVGGGFTGIMLSSATADVVFHETYFVVAHFHQVMAIAAFLGFSSVSNQIFERKISIISILFFTLGTLFLFLPLYCTGLSNVPRRVPSYNYLGWSYSCTTLLGMFIAFNGIILFILQI